ncbi:MAG: hypothetical protein AABX51_00400 [Nanoarchaeota archaeon]
MNLRDICLEQITREEIEQLHRLWYPTNMKHCVLNPFRILTPFNSSSYIHLLEDFVYTQYSDRVSVNNKGKWFKYYTRKMCQADLVEAVQIAQSDCYGQGHLELGFIPERFGEPIKIKFAEIGGLIWGYDLLFPMEYSYLFSWASQPILRLPDCRGVWDGRVSPA